MTPAAPIRARRTRAETEQVVYENAIPRVFWSAMLPVCWVLAPVLGLMAQSQASDGRPLEDRLLQSTLFMALFLAGLGLIGLRVVLGRALEEHQRGRATLVAAISILSSVALIVYGWYAMH